MDHTRKRIIHSAAIIGIAALIGVMNHLAGTPLAQSALVASVCVSLTLYAANERGISIWSSRLYGRFLLWIAIVFASIVGAVIAEYLGLK